ncbi:MAG: crossover junction endodeoxyribonuclease RuvC [Planctomycetota bacterium]|nr:crossover junction endodeoxyribonuclease RuvC [Planctomycetota bacterium]
MSVNNKAVMGMRILGIDPGSVLVGYGCLEIAGRSGGSGGSKAPRPLSHRARNTIDSGAASGRISVVEGGVLRLGARGAQIEDRLFRLADEFSKLLVRLRPDELAIEEAFYGKSVQAALRLGEARGVILAESRRFGLKTHQFSPARIKRAVTGSGAASKDAVASMVERLLSVSAADGQRDVTDALAVALCRAEDRRALSLGG